MINEILCLSFRRPKGSRSCRRVADVHWKTLEFSLGNYTNKYGTNWTHMENHRVHYCLPGRTMDHGQFGIWPNNIRIFFRAKPVRRTEFEVMKTTCWSHWGHISLNPWWMGEISGYPNGKWNVSNSIVNSHVVPSPFVHVYYMYTKYVWGRGLRLPGTQLKWSWTKIMKSVFCCVLQFL